MIKTFYKYRPINNDEQFEFALDIIKKNRFFLSSINHFSDPFDAFQKSQKNNSNLKSLSLTENGNNKLLWSYYTSWYNGIMIELKLNVLNSPFNNLKQIEYTNSEKHLIESLNNNNLYVKSDEFKHEMEWRAIFSENQNFIKFTKNEIQSITIGPSLNQKYCSKLFELSHTLNIPIYEYNKINSIPIMNSKRLLTKCINHWAISD